MALYHSAKGSVDYTVVGNPTIVDGVVSGFSGSDYLETNNNVSANTTQEWNVTFTVGSDRWDDQDIMTSPHNLRIMLSSAKIRVAVGDNESYISTETVQANTTYVVNIQTSNNSIVIKYKEYASSSFVEIYNGVSAVSFGTINPCRFGVYSYTYPHQFKGSIDLNGTYIKVNGKLWFGVCPVDVQKHRLKGPVGYEVVGSPTIVDGVVSGFSANNYLEVNTQVSPSPFETYVSFKTGNSLTGIQTLCENVLDLNNRLELFINAGKLAASVKANGRFIAVTATGSLQLNANTEYIAIFKYTGSSYIYSAISAGTETVIWTLASNDNVFGGNNRIGNNTLADRAFKGSINLNETYIKVNGKLWFYQPADTKYIVKDGKLVWADPRIYLDNSGTTTRNYFSLQTLPKDDTYKVYVRVRPSSLKNNGIFTVNSTNRFAFVLGYNGPVYARIFGSSNTAAGVNYAENDLIEMTASKEGFFGNVAGTSFNVAPAVTPTFSSPATSALLLNAGAGSTFPNDFLGKFYGIKIWSGGVLCEDVVPVPEGLQIGNFTVPSNGLFDMVKQQFYANKGTGDFTIGRDE